MVNGQLREIYNTYISCRSGDNEWHTFSKVFHPTKKTPTVEKIRIMLYAYWPPGEYCFDNVRIEEVMEPEDKIKE